MTRQMLNNRYRKVVEQIAFLKKIYLSSRLVAEWQTVEEEIKEEKES